MCRHREGWVIRVAFCAAAIKRRRVWEGFASKVDFGGNEFRV